MSEGCSSLGTIEGGTTRQECPDVIAILTLRQLTAFHQGECRVGVVGMDGKPVGGGVHGVGAELAGGDSGHRVRR